jgi:hypothetical protein
MINRIHFSLLLMLATMLLLQLLLWLLPDGYAIDERPSSKTFSKIAYDTNTGKIKNIDALNEALKSATVWNENFNYRAHLCEENVGLQSPNKNIHILEMCNSINIENQSYSISGLPVIQYRMEKIKLENRVFYIIPLKHLSFKYNALLLFRNNLPSITLIIYLIFLINLTQLLIKSKLHRQKNVDKHSNSTSEKSNINIDNTITKISLAIAICKKQDNNIISLDYIQKEIDNLIENTKTAEENIEEKPNEIKKKVKLNT